MVEIDHEREEWFKMEVAKYDKAISTLETEKKEAIRNYNTLLSNLRKRREEFSEKYFNLYRVDEE